MKHLTIIGGGMAGLAAAFELQQAIDGGAAARYTLVERADRLGGKVRTEQVGDALIEAGPDSYISQKPWATELIRELGLEDQLIPSRDHLQRVCVVHRRRLVPFPTGFRLAIPTEWKPFVTTPLISPAGKLRMACEPLIPPRKDPGDESLGAFIRRRLGDEALRKMAGPMMAGIYSADPERLSILSTFPMFRDMERKYGSLIRGMAAARKNAPPKPSGNGGMFLSLRDGMHTLPQAIRARLSGEVHTGFTVEAIERTGAGYRVQGEDRAFDTDGILLALPAFAAAPLLNPLLPEAAERLHAIRYLSTATLSLQFARDGFTALEDGVGSGFVVPLSEQKILTACTMSSCKFAHRAPENTVLLRAFVGGPINSASVELPDDELIARVRAELRELSGIESAPTGVRIHRWPDGNPQYDVGHLDRITELDHLLERDLPGVRLTGSACRGVGIPDVVRQGRDAARQWLDG